MVVPQRDEHRDIARIRYALYGAIRVLSAYTPGEVQADDKGGDPVTEADLAVNLAIHDCLYNDQEGWLSEETAADLKRLEKRRVWVVDPIDGTKEFVAGIPEWAVSVGLVEDGAPTAGGILNPESWQVVIGTLDTGVELNDSPASVTHEQPLEGARVLASRSEVGRGEWDRFDGAPFSYVPTGSVAYKMAMVAAGRADATFTLSAKNEWDIAAGVALVHAAGGKVVDTAGEPIVFNKRETLSPGLIAGSPRLVDELLAYLRETGAL